MIEYQHRKEGVFAREGDKDIAYISFIPIDESSVSINHTFVHPDYRGQKIADTLFDLLVERLAQEKMLIEPTCPYVAKKFERKRELSHLLRR